MRENWKPEPREVFGDQEHAEQALLKRERYLEEFRILLHDQRLPVAARGARMGKAFIKIYETTGKNLSIDEFNRFHKEIKEALGESDGKAFINGFLAEFTAAQIFTTITYPAYFPHKGEDLERGVDWWVDLSDVDNGSLAIQVKTLPLKGSVYNQILYPVQNVAQLDSILSTVIVPQNLALDADRVIQATGQYREKITKSVNNLFTVQNYYDDVIPTLMLLGPNDFHPITGKPSEQVPKKVLDSLESFPSVKRLDRAA